MYLNDRLQLNTKRTYSDEGFLQVPSRISRVGIQKYTAAEMGLSDREPKDIIHVFRPEEEVFAQDSLSSFANKPVTDNHPPELVNAKNSRQFSVGHAGPEVTRDGMFAQTLLHITDADAIAKIESGKVELSNGYTADIEWSPGVTPDGEIYDAVQRNIKGNHIAIVERGRAGFECRVADTLPTGDEANMAKITIDGVDFEVTDQAAQAVGKLQSRLKDAEEETKTEAEAKKAKEDEMEEAKKEAAKSEDSLQAKLDDAISKNPSAEVLDKLVTDRATLVADVLKILPEHKWEGKDAATLKSEVVAAKCPTIKMDSVSADYIDARFDTLLENVATDGHSDLTAVISKSVANTDQTKDIRSESTIARDKMIEDSRNAWKSGGSK